MGWRDNLQPASFRGVGFFVETNAQSGGRRIVDFEFPKRDDNYVEDMGRAGRRFTVSAYLIGDDYPQQRDALIAAMEVEGPGTLVLPTSAERQAQPVTYQAVESRVRGRMCEVELTFIDPGSAAITDGAQATQQNVQSNADAAGQASAAQADASLAKLNAGQTIST